MQRRRQAEEVDRLVDDFTQSHTDILFRIHALKQQLRVAYLGGYSPRYIEELLLTLKVFDSSFVPVSTPCLIALLCFGLLGVSLSLSLCDVNFFSHLSSHYHQEIYF